MALSIFVGNLRSHVEKFLSLHKPQSVQEAIRISRVQEEILFELARQEVGQRSSSG